MQEDQIESGVKRTEADIGKICHGWAEVQNAQ